MREVVVDTETTGLDPLSGHRIVEIGCVELINHVPTYQTFQTYLDPEREMPPEAAEISGLTTEFLRGQPRFAEKAESFLAFLGDSPLVIHNAAFDLAFLNAELGRLSMPALPPERAIDTLGLARRKFPGAPASLDALCKRFSIDTAERIKHGALIDARLTAEVYLELIGGRQASLSLGAIADDLVATLIRPVKNARLRPRPLASLLSEVERLAHEAFIAELGPETLWPRRAHAAAGDGPPAILDDRNPRQ